MFSSCTAELHPLGGEKLQTSENSLSEKDLTMLEEGILSFNAEEDMASQHTFMSGIMMIIENIVSSLIWYAVAFFGDSSNRSTTCYEPSSGMHDHCCSI